MSMLLE